jgi:hypothetical protein
MAFTFHENSNLCQVTEVTAQHEQLTCGSQNKRMAITEVHDFGILKIILITLKSHPYLCVAHVSHN